KAAVPVPVAASSLMQVPLIAATLPKGRHVSILTISAESLTPQHLAAVSVPQDTPVAGMPRDCEFAHKILDNQLSLDVAAARNDMLSAGRALMETYPDTGAIVLECTNMVPYADDLQAALNIPVYSIYSFIIWFQAGLRPRAFL
ncbi:MAG: aspartate/glutamate racemase family protein, partial [Hyphomicrobiaceae bacterium]